MLYKKTICILLSLIILIPGRGFSRGRDLVMLTAGTLICAGGITFAIQSAKKKKDTAKETSNILIQPWFPMKDLQLYDFKKNP